MAFPCEKIEVPHRDRITKKEVKTTLVHQYILFIYGIDVADHLCGNCNCQIKIKKWWHCLF
jgi:hypothetical protein